MCDFFFALIFDFEETTKQFFDSLRTNTYPKLPERYRLRNSDGGAYQTQTSITAPTQQQPHSSQPSAAHQRNVYGSLTSTPTTPPPTALSAGQSMQQQLPHRVDDQDQSQEEIYF